MKYLGITGWILAVILLIILLLKSHCTGPIHRAGRDTVSHSVQLLYDQKIYHTDLPAPVIQWQVLKLPADTFYFPLSGIEIDTEAIVRSYYMARYYRQEYSDSNLTALIEDTVYQNEISARRFSYKLLRPVTIMNTTVLKPSVPSRSVYIGMGTMLVGTQFKAGPDVAFQDKKGRIYSFGYLAGKEPGFNVKIAYKLW